jgi:hypothetical protein
VNASVVCRSCDDSSWTSCLSPRSATNAATAMIPAMVYRTAWVAFAKSARPLKILIWADGSRTNVTYYAPAAIAARYGLSAELAAKLAGIDALTDALIAD